MRTMARRCCVSAVICRGRCGRFSGRSAAVRDVRREHQREPGVRNWWIGGGFCEREGMGTRRTMMHWKPREWTLIGMLLLAMPAAMTVMKVAAAAQATSGSGIATRQVTDTVYRADGTPAAGSVIVSWQAFTTASGQ